MFTKTSPFTGITHTKEIPVTISQLEDWQSGTLIQQAMPNISANDREFLMTGITAKEWNDLFGEDR